jgi:hypothetical protein
MRLGPDLFSDVSHAPFGWTIGDWAAAGDGGITFIDPDESGNPLRTIGLGDLVVGQLHAVVFELDLPTGFSLEAYGMTTPVLCESSGLFVLPFTLLTATPGFSFKVRSDGSSGTGLFGLPTLREILEE